MIKYINFDQYLSIHARNNVWKHNSVSACYGQNLRLQSAGVTLKIKPRSSKSNQLLECGKG